MLERHAGRLRAGSETVSVSRTQIRAIGLAGDHCRRKPLPLDLVPLDLHGA